MEIENLDLEVLTEEELEAISGGLTLKSTSLSTSFSLSGSYSSPKLASPSVIGFRSFATCGDYNI